MNAPYAEPSTYPLQQQIGVAETEKYRHSDPSTSAEAVTGAEDGHANQRMMLLVTYAHAPEGGLTSYEAGLASGLSDNPSCCYWKRCSELLSLNLIAAVQDEDGNVVKRRNPTSNRHQRVCAITQAGLDLVR